MFLLYFFHCKSVFKLFFVTLSNLKCKEYAIKENNFNYTSRQKKEKNEIFNEITNANDPINKF